MRAFIAVDVRVSQRLALALAALAKLGAAVRAVRPQQMHVTLAFFADIAPERTTAIIAAMETVAGEEVPFDLAITGVGAFPNERRPSVIWAAIHDAGRLNAIVQRINPPLAAAGFPLEDRPFHPHLTLARVKARPPAALDEWMRHHRQESFGSTRIEQLRLVRSELSPAGAVHDLIHAAALRRSSPADTRRR